LQSADALRDTGGIVPAVRYCRYGSYGAIQFRVDGERKSSSERTMPAAVGLGMNAGIQGQWVDVRVKAVEGLVTNAGLLPLMEHVAFQQTGFRRARYPDLRHVSPL